MRQKIDQLFSSHHASAVSFWQRYALFPDLMVSTGELEINTFQALNYAATDGSPYSFIRHVNAGVIFLGTPFKGTAAHTKAQWLTTYGKLKGERTSLALIKDLKNSTGVFE